VATQPDSLGRWDIAALLLASVAIGIAVSPIMVDVGTPEWVVMAACMLTYSGTGELAYASVIASGGSLGPALAAGLLVSSRFGLLAMSMTGRWAAPLWERIAIAHFASEPSVAVALEAAPRGPAAARRAYWQLAIWMAVGWVVGSAIGLVVGNAIGDIRTVGLDAVFPASFVGALVAAMRHLDSATAAVLGAATALALTPVLPAGLPVLVAALSAFVALAYPAQPLWPRKARR
jgi:predicted branched-subunit amino acid permease